MNPGINDLLDAYDREALGAGPPHNVVVLRCEGEWAGEIHDGRWLHRICRHRKCAVGGPRDRQMQRYHVYDILTGEIVRNYDRIKVSQKGHDHGIR